MTTLKELKPLSPTAFFNVRFSVPKVDKKECAFKKKYLPDGSGLTGEKECMKIALFWSLTGLFSEVEVKLPIEKGDFLEFFIDTRDVKNSNVITRFCHHFIFYPAEQKGMEVTRFRGDDSHVPADPSLLSIKRTVKRSSYFLEIAMPKEVLYGYEPSEFKRLGFTYRFQKETGEKKHFNLSSDFFYIERHPALWASLNLSEEK